MGSDTWVCTGCSNVNEFSLHVCRCGSLQDFPSGGGGGRATAAELREKGVDPEKLLALLKDRPKEGSRVRNLILLLISLWFFYVLGVVEWGTDYLIAIAVAIFIHELGHLAAMKLFGYRNLKILFIPLMGGVAAGVPERESPAENAKIALAGPLFGIATAVMTGVLYASTGYEFLEVYTRLAVYLNVLNLLPIYPLDGGRFFNDLLFSRVRVFELIFKVCAGLLLILGAVMFTDGILGIIGGMVILGLRANYVQITLAEVYEEKFGRSREIDRETVTFLAGELVKKYPGLLKNEHRYRIVAMHIKGAMGRVHETLPTFAQILVMGVLYLIALFLLPSFAMVAVG